MYTWLLNTWENFRSSFWFVPSLLMVGAAAAAWLLVAFDASIANRFADSPYLMELSPAAARSILSSIVGAIVTSTGVVFSMTIVALSLASSQFGSRLIRTYRNRRSTHFTLGIFVGTSLYCILVLASIRENGDRQFVPTVAVTAGIVLTVICLATLIYYIHDISKAIQAPNVIQSSANDLHSAINRLFPTKSGESGSANTDNRLPAVCDEQQLDSASPLLNVECDEVGYVQAIKNESVLELAIELEVVIRLQLRPGDFVQEGCPLAQVFAADPKTFSLEPEKSDGIVRRLRGCLIVGVNRTPTQDVRYAFNELVEIAVRALSSGINDPYTAVTCVDQIHAALSEIRRRDIPTACRFDEDGRLRVIATPVSLDECFDGSINVIDHYAENSPMVRSRIAQVREDLADSKH